MGSSAKFHDDGRAPSWGLYGHGNKRINSDERPISMMMTELPLGLSMILDRKAVPLAHLGNKNIDERPISMMMSELPLGLSIVTGCDLRIGCNNGGGGGVFGRSKVTRFSWNLPIPLLHSMY